MKYSTYLKNKNLSKTTINIYLKNYEKWLSFLKDNNPTKRLFVCFLNKNKHLSANSVRLLYSSILQSLKFERRWKLLNEFKDIKLPNLVQYNKTIINWDEYENIKNKIEINNWHDKRNWLIFSFMFLTGIRGSELNQIRKNKIVNNCINIIGKGNKERIIFIPKYILGLLKDWKLNKINISKSKLSLTHKQLNLIIARIGMTYFNKKISSHSLRRSYATNLLRKNIDIKTISKLMGHSNINTTSRYIQLTNDEILSKIESIFR